MFTSQRLFAEVGDSRNTKKRKIEFQLRHLQTSPTRTNDDVHSNIEICPIMKAVIDTPHFQRLRGLKQLGTTDFVYMNATHSRFEHSIGVAHLANQLCARIQNRQPLLLISEKDIVCVTLGALCHDLGHGAYSHVYDGLFPTQLAQYLEDHKEKRTLYNGLPDVPSDWQHEQASLMMIDGVLDYHGLEIDMNNLDEPPKQVGDGIAAESFRVGRNQDVLTSRDWIFIKEIVIGKPLGPVSEITPNTSGFIGRPDRHQEFLYDIVANRHNGLDVDKIDYFARDERRTMKGNGEISQRLIEEAHVAWGICPKPASCFRCNGIPQKHLMICYPYKCVPTAMDFFHKRLKAHSQIYTHKMGQSSAFLICDILIAADAYFRIPSGNPDYPNGLPISRAMLDPTSYLHLKDSIIDVIDMSTTPELQKARDLIQKLRRRDLYKLVGVKKLRSTDPDDNEIALKSTATIKEELMATGRHIEPELGLTIWDFIVDRRKVHCGAGKHNPVLAMRFMSKEDCLTIGECSANNLPEASQIDEHDFEAHTPRVFQEISIRVFCRTASKYEGLKKVFDAWDKREDEETRYSPIPPSPAKSEVSFKLEVTAESPLDKSMDSVDSLDGIQVTQPEDEE